MLFNVVVGERSQVLLLDELHSSSWSWHVVAAGGISCQAMTLAVQSAGG